MNTIDLDQLCSYKKHGPIREASSMFAPVEWNKDGMNEAWKEGLTSKWWSVFYKNVEQLSKDELTMREFGAKLLSFGGHDTCFAHGPDEDLDKLMTRGQLWYPKGLKMMRGENCQCHSNSARLWDANREGGKVFIATGYALSEDGMWRQHSWCIQVKPRSVNVVETTVPRTAYFGFVLNEEEAEDFYDNNAW